MGTRHEGLDGEGGLSDTWTALEPGADPVRRAGELRRAHEAFVTATGGDAAAPRAGGAGGAGSAGAGGVPLRPVVAESWWRCARARVSPEGAASVELDEEELAAYRAAHPLAAVMPVVRELTGAFATDGEHLVALCDAYGRLLWVEGHPRTLRSARRMNFVPGARWSESAMGTNAPGTALAVDRPVQVFAAEHFRRPVQAWTCAAAPVHDPRTGRLLGAVDVTGGDRLAHPHSLAFVQAVARAAESHLALRAPAPAPDRVRLCALGRDEALLTAGGRTVRLSRRHSEIVVVLAAHPQGLCGDELLTALYEDGAVTPVTLRAELSRLRGLLGPELLRSRPYRLGPPVDADFDAVARRLSSGAVTAALGAYAGPLLPGSWAPGVARLRRRLADGLRAALVARGDPELLADWAHSPWGEDDVEVWRALSAVVPAERRPQVLARVRALDAELAAPGWAARGPSPRATRSQRPAP
ncbi:GAF domain-containing protein [Streptomyces changanensis]|uniref:Transcriptional regulator n=2 Tax=Streptomyces TaxID=1883 RepID=A0A124EDC2_9ACTN|nr:GAF domain-containing protein [Streptomyces changanensis]KUH40296.1 transcriptional regulator [Streptomyces kanasensis]UUS34293.1 GAF domain-containing protein [Streptomyces changanensis]